MPHQQITHAAMKFSRVGHRDLLVLVLVLALFIIDWLTPVGYDVWIFYVIPLILASRVCSPRVVMLAATISSGLIVIAPFLSPHSPGLSTLVTFNGMIGIAVIWLTVSFLLGGRQAEEGLRSSEERFRFLVERVKDYAIILLDPEGRVVTWNIGAQRLMQYEASEIVGESIARFYPQEDRATGLPDHVLDVARRKGWAENEGWRIRKDGSRFMADVMLTALLDDMGRLRGFAKVTHDITERKRTGDALRRQEVMTRVFEERESVARNLHDGILQSLYAVRLGLEGCRRSLATHPQDAIPEIDARIEEVGLMIAEVRDLMVGQDPPWARASDLRKGVEELLSMSQASDRPVWRLHTPEQDGAAGMSSEQIKHLLYMAREAISNVVRHASAESCDVTLASAKNCLRLTIEDDGVGFAPDTAQGSGRGFGNMKARARQLGARIDIASTPGRGTRITIEMTKRESHVSS